MKVATANFDLKESYVGTCQACFHAQVIKATGKSTIHKLVLHGYERPGYGEIKGECAGVNHPPYELDCELTKQWKKSCERSLAVTRDHLADLQADKVEVFTINVVDYDARKPGYGMPRPTKPVSLKRGESYSDPKTYRKYTFDGARQHGVQRAENRIRELIQIIEELDGRIKAWKYNPEALMTHETIKREEQAAREQNKLAAGFRRDWKELWKNVAYAIAEHKRVQDYLDENRERAARTDAQYKADFDTANLRFGGTLTFDLADEKARDVRSVAGHEAKLTEKYGRPFPSNKERKAVRGRAKAVK